MAKEIKREEEKEAMWESEERKRKGDKGGEEMRWLMKGQLTIGKVLRTEIYF